MRMSDWSSDVCSSDLSYRRTGANPDRTGNPDGRSGAFRPRPLWRMKTMTIGCSTTGIELASLVRWTTPAPPIGAAERRARLAAAQARMAEIGADALLLNAGPSLRYFTGVAWSPSERLVAMLLPVAGEPRIICPAFAQGSPVAALAISPDLLLS